MKPLFPALLTRSKAKIAFRGVNFGNWQRKYHNWLWEYRVGFGLRDGDGVKTAGLDQLFPA